MSYHTNSLDATKKNPHFRQVLYTGAKSQLVVMRIPPGGEVGEEIHDHVEQTLFVISGSGEALLDDRTLSVVAGDAIVVSPGTRHNVRNTGDTDLEITTVYAPPNHIDGRVHPTKADADADLEDENFGHAVR